MFKKNFIYYILILLTLTSCSGKPQQRGPQKEGFKPSEIEVETYKVKPISFSDNLNLVGEIKSIETTTITSDIKGKLISLNISEGDLVSSGTELARIDDRDTKAEIEINKAKYSKAQAYYNRIKNLNEEGAVSNQDVDNAYESLKTAKGEFNRSRIKLSKLSIKAPFDGILGLKEVGSGSYIKPGEPIVKLTKINPIDISFQVPERYLKKVKIGRSISFKVSGETGSYSAKIFAIDPQINSQSRTINVKARTYNTSKRLLPGRFTNISLPTSYKKDAISVPIESIIQEGTINRVLTVNSEGVAEERIVQVGSYGERFVEITKGIKNGEVVITSGHQKVRPGNKVKILPYKEITNEELS